MRAKRAVIGVALLGAAAGGLYLLAAPRLRDELAFSRAKKADKINEYRRYLVNYPKGAHAEEAKSMLVDAALSGATERESAADLDYFARRFSDDPRAEDARKKSAELAFRDAQKQDTQLAYEKFTQAYPDFPDIAVAWSRLNEAKKKKIASASGATYYRDIEPLFRDNCTSCHLEGGIAPYPLLTYEDALEHAASIGTEVSTRRMPPWHADNTGVCNTWQDARWLTDEQVAMVSAWVAAGAPKGNEGDSFVKAPASTVLTNITKRLEMPGVYAPNASLSDDYRCFPLDIGESEDKYLVAYQVTPGELRVVHHVIAYAVDEKEEDDKAAALDAAEPGLGYTCFGAPGVKARFVAGWTPGSPATDYPEGTGVLLKGGRKLILQVHYTLENGGSFPDRTVIDLRLADRVDRPAYIDKLSAAVNLPPNMQIQTSHAWTLSQVFPFLRKGTLWGIYPHMHLLGKSQRVDISRNGVTSCMVDVPVWDFHWQQFYMYEKPIVVGPEDEMTITCNYDTMGQTKTVTWGDGSRDEMCLAYMYVTE